MSELYSENNNENIVAEGDYVSAPQTETVVPEEAAETVFPVDERILPEDVPAETVAESVPVAVEAPAPEPEYRYEESAEQGNYDARQTIPPQNMMKKGDGTTGKTVAALILGIAGILLGGSFVLSLPGLACAIIGLVLSVKEKKEHPSGMITAAFILSIIGLAVSALCTVSCVACMGLVAFGGAMDSQTYWDVFNSLDYNYF